MKDNRRMKKVLSILLCLCIVLSYVPMPALAEEITCTHHVHEGCTFDPSTCADCAVITNQPADWCGNSLCSQEDNAHAPGCAWYVRTYEECKCVLSCSEEGLNDYCETCYFEGVDACGGEEEAIVFTDFEISDGRLIKYNGSGGNITIPETVTSIDVYAFDGCSSLESVTIPGSVTTIWNYAFRNCTNLRSVTISGSVETINSYAFLGCSSLQSVTISGSVTTIGNYVFNACSNLRSLTISGSVTTIENYAFNGCSGLEEITISGSVTTIVNNAFNGCTGLTTVNVPCNWENSLYNFGDNVNVQKADHSFGTDGKCICGAECSHSYDAEGKCTVCNCVGGIIDVSTLTSDLMITDTGYSMNGMTYLYNGAYTLTGTTSHGVIFEAGEYQLTANNLKIVKMDTYSGSAIELKNGANLHLVLADGSDNTLTGGWEGSGIRVNEGTSLVISGNGTLHAGYQQGGNAAHGAAIGGYCDSNFGTITINGGTIYATGTSGASIGSGDLYITGNTMTGTIELNGGTIYADLIGNAKGSGAVLKGSGAKVYCDSIRADISELSNIIYSKNGTSANVYNDLTLFDDFEVPGAGLIVKEGAVLTIPEGKTLTIPQNRQLICYGAIVNNGTIAGAGTVVNCLAQSDLTGSGTVAQTVSVKAVGSHVYGQWEYKDANIHIKTCQNGCGKTLTEGHIFENDVCTGCGQVKPWRYDETNRTLYILADLTIDDMFDIRAYDAECIVFAEGVRSIPDDVFHSLHAYEVRSVHIPESIERIGLFAFDFGFLVGNTAIVFYCPEDIKDEVANSGVGHYGEAKVYVSYKMEDGLAKVTEVEVSDPAQIDSNAVLDTVLYGKNVYFADGTLTNFPNTPHIHRGAQWTNNSNGTCTGLCVVCGTANLTQAHSYSTAGKCENCGQQAVASVTVNGTATYYENWSDALTAANATDGCIMTLLNDLQGLGTVVVTSDLVLNLNGHELENTSVQIGTDSNPAEVTITGEGNITANNDTVKVSYGSTLNLQGGTLSGTVSNYGTLNISGGKLIKTNNGNSHMIWNGWYDQPGKPKLTISGGEFETDKHIISNGYGGTVEITGGKFTYTNDLYTDDPAGITVSGGEFISGLKVSRPNVSKLLKTGYACYRVEGETRTKVTYDELQTISLSGKIVVDVCEEHDYSDAVLDTADNTKHTLICKYCGIPQDSAAHTFVDNACVCGAVQVPYLLTDGTTTATVNALPLSTAGTMLESSWYYVDQAYQNDNELQINGNVNLILTDKSFTSRNIYIQSGSLTVWAQSAESSAHTAMVYGAGNFTLNGGKFTVEDSDLDGGRVSLQGQITVNNGALAVTAGHMGGVDASSLTINGGSVTVDAQYGMHGIEADTVQMNGGKFTITGRMQLFRNAPVLNAESCWKVTTNGAAVPYSTWHVDGYFTDHYFDDTTITIEVCSHSYSYEEVPGDPAKHIKDCSWCGDSGTETHGYTYTASGNRISAVCSCGHTGSLEINEIVPQTYTGRKVQTTLSGTIDGVASAITYCCADGCVNAGTHTAKVVLGNAEATMQFEILKVDTDIGKVTADVLNNSLDTSEIVLTRENSTVPGILSVNAGQTLTVGNNTIKYTFTPNDTTNYKTVTGEVTVTVADTIAPTGKVTISTKSWTEFLNSISFGLFFKETQTVSVVAADNLSGVAKIEYIESKTAMDLDAVKAATQWTEMKNGSVSVTLEDTKQFVYYIRITDKSGNVSYLSSDGAEYDTSAPVIAGVNNGVTYYTTQKVTISDKNIDTITLNGEAATSTITMEGNKEATYIIVATDKVGNTTTVTVKMAPIADIAESMDGMTSNDVTSADKTALQTVVDTVTELLKDKELPAEEKNALEKAKADAEALLTVIENADKAADTENTDKVEDVTADNVTPDDKSDLGKAKADLEKALDNNGGNYTAEEKKAIEDELKRIDDALKVIENVEAVEDVISDLPATVVPDDEENVAKIEAAKKSYNELTDYEKSLVNPETKEKLDKLTKGIVAYDIVKGDGSAWTQGTNDSVSFTVNGLTSKFSGIKIDGKAVDAQHYDVTADSSIITLKASYLETLAAGEHSITVVYTDGETSGTFMVQAKVSTPATGDNGHLMLWFSLMIVSCAAILILLNYKRFISYGGKYSK